MQRVRHGSIVAILVGKRRPITDVVYFEPAPADDLPHDSGFTVLLDDAPPAWELRPNDSRMQTDCLHCLIEEYPEVGIGLDMAKQHGAANCDPDSGEWFPEEKEEED